MINVKRVGLVERAIFIISNGCLIWAGIFVLKGIYLYRRACRIVSFRGSEIENVQTPVNG